MRGAAAALLLLTACENGGPAPRLDDSMRALVCNVTGASFDVHGQNLAGAHLELQRVETVVGVAVTEDPLLPTAQLMGDYLHVPLDGAPEGAYDVTAVKGPERWTTRRGLGILPPPSVTLETPTSLCDAQQAQSLTVRGSGFVFIGDSAPQVTVKDAQGLMHLTDAAMPVDCVPAVASVLDNVQLCNGVTVTVPPGQLDPGLYYAVVANPAPLGCASMETMPFMVNAAPTVNDMQTTATLCIGGGSLDIMGSNFAVGATVALSGATPDSTTRASDTEMVADFSYSPAFNPGDKLSVTVANPDGCRSPMVGSVTIKAGPVLLGVDPPIVYKPLRTGLTLYLSSLTSPIMNASIAAGAPPVTLTAQADGTTRATAEVPPNLAAGKYDLTFSDGSGCGTILKAAVQIVDQANLTLDSVRPAFADRSVEEHITVRGPNLTTGSRVFLAPDSGSPIVQVPAQLENGALHGLVPSGIAAGSYGVVVIAPDGSVGVLDDAATPFHSYQATDGALPSVTRVAPRAVSAGCIGCQITLDGSGFGVAPSISATCFAPGGAVVASPAFALFGTPSDSEVIVDAGALAALPHGTSCKLFVVNHDAAVTPLAEAPEPVVVAAGPAPVVVGDSTFETGPSLVTVRRAPAVVVADAEPGSRFLYALGGDSGTLPSAHADGEFAPIGPAGLGKWSTLPGSLPSATTLAGAVASGHFIFLVGGHDNAASLTRVARAQVLDPNEAPEVDDFLVAMASSGIPAGARYYYRVSARYAGDDPINPNGESLAGPPRSVGVAPLATAYNITVNFSGGGVAGHSLAGFRLYRGTAPDQLDRYVDLPASSGVFVDDNSQFSSSQAPLPLGALGRFTINGVPQLNSARAGAAIVSIADAVLGRSFLYAAFGWDGASLPASYEVLQLDSGVPGAQFTQTALGTGRWLCGGWSATPELDSKIAQRTVYFGQGVSNTTLISVMNSELVGEMNVAQVGVAGVLTPSPGPTVAQAFGYGTFGGGDALMMVGGAKLLDTPGSLLLRAPFGASAPIPDAWAPIDLLPSLRFLPGVAGDGPYVFVVGGGSTFFTASTETSAGLF